MIRANDILPGPLPIWDQGTLTRTLTLKESRDLVAEFRNVREDYGRIVVKFREMEERTAVTEKQLRAALHMLLFAKGRQQVKSATLRAVTLLGDYADEDMEIL